MLKFEEVQSALSQLVEEHDKRIAKQVALVNLLRNERRNVARASHSLEEASPAMQALRSSIEKELSEIDERAEVADQELTIMKSQRRRIAKASELLNGASSEGSAPRAAQVRPLVWDLLKQNGHMSYEEVYDLVRKKLADEGIAAQGLGLRVREALTNKSVDSDEAGLYYLKRANGNTTIPISNPKVQLNNK